MIYIVLPAYNEEQTIGPLLDAIKANMEESGLAYGVLIVNDGSTDNTMDAIGKYSGAMPIKVIEHEKNKGLAEALKTGLMNAASVSSEKDIIVTMDSDNTHTPGLIMRMVRMIREGYDVVIGSRYQKGARVIGVPFKRKVMSFGASMIFRVLFPIKGVKDYTSGYRAYTARLIMDMFDKYGADFINQPGFSCMVDVLLKIRRYPVIAGEAPLILRYDKKAGSSKMNVSKTVKETLRLIVKRLSE